MLGNSVDAVMALADQLTQLSGGGIIPSTSGDVFQQATNSQPRALFGKGLCESTLLTLYCL